MEPSIYLFFDGCCEEAMRHYALVLGGTITGVVRNADAPTPQDRMPGGDALVMNLGLQLGRSLVMASDCPPGMYGKPQGFAVCISPASLAEFDRIFAALAESAREVGMAPAETFWAERFAMFTDRFGTPWMLNFGGAKDAAAAQPASDHA